MSPYLDAAVAIFFSLTGVALGLWFTRLPRPWWALGYLIALALVLANTAANYFPILEVTPPLSWILLGRREYATMGFIAALALVIPLSRLPRKKDRLAVSFFLVLIIARLSIWPCLAPLASRHELEHLKTLIDRDGICLQTTDYTCGPASAVTALRRLGFPAEEGRIAIFSSTSTTAGTSDTVLAESLRREYGKDGLQVDFRVFDNLQQLKEAGITLAVVKFSFFVDHFVTVLEVTDKEVVVGDPGQGLERLSHEEFLKKWRYVGVVLKRVR